MILVSIGLHAPENQARLLLLFESGTFAQNEALRPTGSYHGNDLFIPQGNLHPHKNLQCVHEFASDQFFSMCTVNQFK